MILDILMLVLVGYSEIFCKHCYDSFSACGYKHWMGICMYVGYMCAHVRDTLNHTQHTHISGNFDVYAFFSIVMWITQWILGGSEMHQCTHYSALWYPYDGTTRVSLCAPNPLKYSNQVYQFHTISCLMTQLNTDDAQWMLHMIVPL